MTVSVPDAYVLARRDLSRLVADADLPTAMLAYLAATTRLCQRPLFVSVTGSLGSGKSALIQTITKLMPPADVISIADGTPRWLETLPPIDGRVELAGKLIAIDERASALPDGRIIRSLYESGTVDRRGPRGEVVTFVGCPSLMEGTTLERISDEDASRRLVLAMSEDPEKFREIRRRIAKRFRSEAVAENDGAVFERHRQLQQQLPRTCRVDNPFGEQIAERFPAGGRQARSYQQVLSVMEALTLLRHALRQVEGHPAILRVSLDDYRVVRELFGPVLKSMANDLSQGAIETVAAINAGLKECPVNDPRRVLFARRDVEIWARVSRQSVQRRTDELVDHGILVIVSLGRRGKAHGLRLAADWEQRLQIPSMLPAPEELRVAVGAA